MWRRFAGWLRWHAWGRRDAARFSRALDLDWVRDEMNG